LTALSTELAVILSRLEAVLALSVVIEITGKRGDVLSSTMLGSKGVGLVAAVVAVVREW
jgi:hypothetical protein